MGCGAGVSGANEMFDFDDTVSLAVSFLNGLGEFHDKWFMGRMMLNDAVLLSSHTVMIINAGLYYSLFDTSLRQYTVITQCSALPRSYYMCPCISYPPEIPFVLSACWLLIRQWHRWVLAGKLTSTPNYSQVLLSFKVLCWPPRCKTPRVTNRRTQFHCRRLRMMRGDSYRSRWLILGRQARFLGVRQPSRCTLVLADQHFSWLTFSSLAAITRHMRGVEKHRVYWLCGTWTRRSHPWKTG